MPRSVDLIGAGLWAIAAASFLAAALLYARNLKPQARDGAPCRLTVLVLLRNQEEQIEGFLYALLQLLHERPPAAAPAQVVLVDAGSTDQTREILTRLARHLPQVQVVQLSPEQAERPWASAMSLCFSRVVLLVDLREPVDGAALLRSIARSW